MQLFVVGGGGEAVRREACRGVEQDGEQGKPRRLMDEELEEGIRPGVSWMRRATCERLSRRGVGWMCWSRRRRGVKEVGVLRCSAGRLDGAADDGGTNSVNFVNCSLSAEGTQRFLCSWSAYRKVSVARLLLTVNLVLKGRNASSVGGASAHGKVLVG